MPTCEGKVFKKRRGGFNYRSRPSTSSTNSSRSEVLAQAEPSKHSSSHKKLSDKLVGYENESDFRYCIIDLKQFSNTLQTIGVCRVCKHSLTISSETISGLACKIKILCPSCSASADMINSDKLVIQGENDSQKNIYDINARLVYGLRCVGRGQTSAKTLCGIMNLPPPPGRYHEYELHLGSVMSSVCKKSMKDAVEEAVDRTNSRDLCVAIDGSWQRRGHTSLNGIVSMTSVETGKVIDISVLSKYCLCPQKSINIHLDGCKANYIGTSGGMEVAGALEMFQRSQNQYNVRYIDYLGDGDSKAFQAVCNAQPYGPDIEIKKLECIGHVEKRMGTRLRNLKAQHRKLSDGKTLGGKNRLTDTAIQKIQIYYGLAIKRNVESVSAMHQAVWALYFHVSSSNEEPKHQLCPDTDDTWCKFRKAQKEGTVYDHNCHFHLPKIIMNEIKYIFRDLSDKKLLEKCIRGKTQNPNESLNNVIWTVLPKRVFVGIESLHFGVYEAITRFNDGNRNKIQLFEEMKFIPGSHMMDAMRKLDEERIQKSERKFNDIEKKIRQKRILSRRRLEDQYQEAEDPEAPSYSAGGY